MACGCPSEQCYCFLTGDALTGGSGGFANPWVVENLPFAATSPLNSIQLTPGGVKNHAPGIDVRLSADPDNAAEYAADGILVNRCGIVTAGTRPTGQLLIAGPDCTTEQLDAPSTLDVIVGESGGAWGERPLISSDAGNGSIVGSDGGVYSVPTDPTVLFTTGMMIDFAGTSAQVPAGWLAANGDEVIAAGVPVAGQVLSPTLHAFLTASGLPYGNVGANPRLPDLRGRASYGLGTNADVNALGDNEGAALASRTPRHGHTIPSLTVPALSIPALGVSTLGSNNNVFSTAQPNIAGVVKINAGPVSPQVSLNTHAHNVAIGAAIISASGLTTPSATGAGATVASSTTQAGPVGLPSFLTVNKIIKT